MGSKIHFMQKKVTLLLNLTLTENPSTREGNNISSMSYCERKLVKNVPHIDKRKRPNVSTFPHGRMTMTRNDRYFSHFVHGFAIMKNY